MPAKLIDLAGQRFGRLVVHHRAPPEVGQKPRWVCVCDCGAMRMIYGYALTRGDSTSCGCLQREELARRRTTHGERKLDDGALPGDDTRRRKSLTYASWCSMRTRCRNPKGAGYPEYGGRGIKICERWDIFENFLADLGPRPRGTSLERREVDGDYEPDNCYWATDSQQMLNRRDSRQFTTDELADIGRRLVADESLTSIAAAYGVGLRVIKRIRNAARRAV